MLIPLLLAHVILHLHAFNTVDRKICNLDERPHNLIPKYLEIRSQDIPVLPLILQHNSSSYIVSKHQWPFFFLLQLLLQRRIACWVEAKKSSQRLFGPLAFDEKTLKRVMCQFVAKKNWSYERDTQH